jgi:hypothetical protein
LNFLAQARGNPPGNPNFESRIFDRIFLAAGLQEVQDDPVQKLQYQCNCNKYKLLIEFDFIIPAAGLPIFGIIMPKLIDQIPEHQTRENQRCVQDNKKKSMHTPVTS